MLRQLKSLCSKFKQDDEFEESCKKVLRKRKYFSVLEEICKKENIEIFIWRPTMFGKLELKFYVYEMFGGLSYEEGLFYIDISPNNLNILNSNLLKYLITHELGHYYTKYKKLNSSIEIENDYLEMGKIMKSYSKRNYKRFYDIIVKEEIDAWEEARKILKNNNFYEYEFEEVRKECLRTYDFMKKIKEIY